MGAKVVELRIEDLSQAKLTQTIRKNEICFIF